MARDLLGVVISNCQAQPIKHALSLLCHGVRFDSFGVHLLPLINRDKLIEQFIQKVERQYDVVISVALGDAFGPLSVNQIKQTFASRNVILVPNFFFSGLHPDLTYLGDMGQRVVGPLSEYHSKLVLLGYVSGLSPEDTEALFNEEVYSRLGFFREYEKSLGESYRRDEQLSVTFSQEMEGLLKRELCFLSVNHPTSFLLSEFCSKLARELEARGIGEFANWPGGSATLVNYLAKNVIFPVYPEIVRYHNLGFSGSYLFKPAGTEDDAFNPLRLREFIRREMKVLSDLGPDKLMGSRQVGPIIRKNAELLNLKI